MKWRRPVLLWAGITLVLVAVTYAVPDEWFGALRATYRVPEQSASPFGQNAEATEATFDDSPHVIYSPENSDSLTATALRKLLRLGKLNSEELERAKPIIESSFTRLNDRRADRARVIESTTKELVEVLPRLDAAKVRDTMSTFYSKVRFEPGGKPAPACQDCHQQVRTLPDDRRFDASGIYPGIDPARFRHGRAIPVLNEVAEIESAKKLFGEEIVPKSVCTDCHANHEDPDFAITKKDRQDNLGFWINLDVDPIPGMLDVEVKLKSFYSAHRVPAGFPSRAYVITLEVTGPDGDVPLWHGPRLPEPLRRNDVLEPGLVFARRLIDKDGKLTGDPAKAVDLLEDDRLQHNRFTVDHFLFQIGKNETATIQGTLHYLPNFPSWKGSEVILTAEKSR